MHYVLGPLKCFGKNQKYEAEIALENQTKKEREIADLTKQALLNQASFHTFIYVQARTKT